MNILIKQKKSKLLRINRFLALNLNVSRRDSDILVENKSIKINGVIANHGDLVDNDEQLKIHKLTEIKKLTYEIVLKTGKNREIRRIFDINNIPIKNLKRIQVDKFEIGKMKIGQLKKIKLT